MNGHAREGPPEPRPSAGPRRLPSAAVGRRTARTRRPPWPCRTSGTTERRRGGERERPVALRAAGRGTTGLAGQRGEVPARGTCTSTGPRARASSRCARRWTGGGRSPPRGRARARRLRHEHPRAAAHRGVGCGDRLQLAAVDPRLDGRRAGEATGEQRGALETRPGREDLPHVGVGAPVVQVVAVVPPRHQPEVPHGRKRRSAGADHDLHVPPQHLEPGGVARLRPLDRR